MANYVKRSDNADRSKRSSKRDAIFFEELADHGIIGKAAEKAGYSRRSVYEYKEEDKDFKAQWNDALERSTERLEEEVLRRAREGVESYVTSQGKQVFVEVVEKDPATGELKSKKVPLIERKHSDTLAIFLLKARRPEVYRERYEVATVNRGDQAPTQLTEEELERIAAKGLLDKGE